MRNNLLRQFEQSQAQGRGWVDAGELEVGDWLLTATGRWLMVEEVHDTGEVHTVYNFEVADHHTYFVGTPDWPALAWVHNANRQYSVPAAGQRGGSGDFRPRVIYASTRKKAKDIARNIGKGKPIHDPHDAGQQPHYHPVDSSGKKMRPSIHVYYPPSFL
ncbi:MAG TPA: polymorphic toxin-type HINT domain-containing protein [Gemmatales bacterium]|nr:polymorphic toxin-type HINT domain-containing protein [Gemmatales bacterium]